MEWTFKFEVTIFFYRYINMGTVFIYFLHWKNVLKVRMAYTLLLYFFVFNVFIKITNSNACCWFFFSKRLKTIIPISWDTVFKRLMIDSVYKYQRERETHTHIHTHTNILINRLAVVYRKIIEIIVALFKQENVSLLEICGKNCTKTK